MAKFKFYKSFINKRTIENYLIGKSWQFLSFLLFLEVRLFVYLAEKSSDRYLLCIVLTRKLTNKSME
jgi:hypothetical protein